MSAPTSSLPQQPRVRRNNAGSPCRLHPIRAIVPYQLLLGGPSCPALSPSLSAGGNSGPTTSGGGSSSPSPTLSCGAHGIWEPKFPTRQRLSPENKGCRSPDWGPNSPVCRGERSKPQVRSSSAIRRTSSLDAITGPYLTGQWPRDFHEPCMKDKATQTHGIWVEDTGGEQGRPHQRSASWGSADHLKEVGTTSPPSTYTLSVACGRTSTHLFQRRAQHQLDSVLQKDLCVRPEKLVCRKTSRKSCTVDIIAARLCAQ